MTAPEVGRGHSMTGGGVRRWGALGNIPSRLQNVTGVGEAWARSRRGQRKPLKQERRQRQGDLKRWME